MNYRPYVILSGVVFVAVATLHLLRVAMNWTLQIGNWDTPHWLSVVAGVFAAILAAWAFRLAKR